MDIQRLADNGADRHARIQAGERILEDDLHVLAIGAHGSGRELGDIAALEEHSARGGLDQAQDGAPDGCFAGAGFADEAYHLARLDGERHIFYGSHGGWMARQKS